MFSSDKGTSCSDKSYLVIESKEVKAAKEVKSSGSMWRCFNLDGPPDQNSASTQRLNSLTCPPLFGLPHCLLPPLLLCHKPDMDS